MDLIKYDNRMSAGNMVTRASGNHKGRQGVVVAENKTVGKSQVRWIIEKDGKPIARPRCTWVSNEDLIFTYS